ncbi:response regulator [Cohnella xylanilytica]|uniref:Response regulator n=1 Tax=Cohnella xylanilytica TaxID=557555 RepID=A0A841TSQ7_9BACL|nr:response regulator [Cohnella xylanilytica]MBB6691326.1 response regulator [Cohnella xylanilytica]
MIRAVVVDDERLVRKGFISLIDWSAHGIAIVGEAGDGKSALDLLDTVEADLLFTDITMPHMSGFELIKAVRSLHPRIRSVVLTCHHEFDYVHEALRLGAIDYIVKTLLELENADDVIRRILERFDWEEASRAAGLAADSRKRIAASSALLFVPRSREEAGGDLLRLPSVRRNALLDLGRMWLSPLVHPVRPEEAAREAAGEWGDRWRIVSLSRVGDEPLDEVSSVLEAAVPGLLFYSRAKPGEAVRADYRELARPAGAVRGADACPELDPERDPDLRWAFCAEDRERLLRRIAEKKPPKEAIEEFGARLCREWEPLLLRPAEAERLREETERNVSWADWENWLGRFSDKAKGRMAELGLSKEVMLCLLRAVQFMRRHAGNKINQNDVAAHVSMSRSYFSQCFARFAGQSFGDLLRTMRLERAKSLLLTTSIPVYEIAAAAGFEDDKYFSKLFRDKVGKLPTEFRACGGERDNGSNRGENG